MTSYIAAVGCSGAATPGEIAALVDDSCREAGIAPADLLAIASHARLAHRAALRQAASALGLPLHFLPATVLGGEGVCEPVARAVGALLQGKRKSAHATCALAQCSPDLKLEGFGQPAMSSAAMASSSVTTSWAGP